MTHREEQEEAIEQEHEYIMRVGTAGLGPKDPVPQSLHNFAVGAAEDHVAAIREQARQDKLARLRGIADNL